MDIISVVVTAIMAYLMPILNWFRVRHALWRKPKNLLYIEPRQGQGENIFHLAKKATDPRHFEEFFVNLHFLLINRNLCDINVVDIDLEYEATGIPAKKTIFIDNKEQSLDGNCRMNHSYQLATNTIANIRISKRFMCTYASADDYKKVTIKIYTISPAWKGERSFKIIGELRPLGEFYILSYAIEKASQHTHETG